MKAFTDKSKVIDTIGDRVGGESRPILFASSSSRRQHLPTPPRHEMRGSNGSSYFGCARNDLRSKDRSRRTVQSSQYEPNGSARVGEGRSVVRGRVLSQSLLVARERRRRELGSNLVIDTIALTSGEGHVVEVGISRRVRKILAGVPASVSIRDHILAPSFSRSVRQYWTVGNRPIRNNDLRSLHRNSVEAQIQDRSRQKTGLNTAPGFSRVSNKPPLRGAKGTPEIHHPRASPRTSRHSRKPPSFPRTTPSFPRTREPRKKQSTPSPRRFAKGDASAASRGMPEIHRNTPTTAEHPPPTTSVPSPARRERARVRAQGGAGHTLAAVPPPPTPNPKNPMKPKNHTPNPHHHRRTATTNTPSFPSFPILEHPSSNFRQRFSAKSVGKRVEVH